VIAENDPDEQQKQIRYNDLLASAVILQNAIDMARIVEDLRRQGWPISNEDLASLSPYLGERQKVAGLSCKLLQNHDRRWRSSTDARGRSCRAQHFSAVDRPIVTSPK
jgi:hypothetical protein